jgi:branched-chain amino acid transport system ATP-binding protein
MLRIDELHVRYGRITALHGISLSVEEGEIVAVIGPNGAGKSTMLHSIAGVVPVSSGLIQFGGESIVRRTPEAIVRAGIALVPEGRRIFSRLTVEENLRLGATTRRRGIPPADELERIFELFPILKTYLRSIAGKLSGGEQQQLSIARALLARPRLLLLDEPSLGLAPMVIESIFRSFAELREEGMTILLVEQNALGALEICDRAYVLRNGSISFEGEPQALLRGEALETAYFGFSRPSETAG